MLSYVFIQQELSQNWVLQVWRIFYLLQIYVDYRNLQFLEAIERSLTRANHWFFMGAIEQTCKFEKRAFERYPGTYRYRTYRSMEKIERKSNLEKRASAQLWLLQILA